MKKILLAMIFLVALMYDVVGGYYFHRHPTPSFATEMELFFFLKLPRLFLVCLIGACLSVLGSSYQMLLKNPLADPYLFGVSSMTGLCMYFFRFEWFGYLEASMGSDIKEMISLIVLGLTAGLCVSVFMYRVYFQSYNSQGEETSFKKIILFGILINYFLSSFLFLVLSMKAQKVGGGNSLQWFFGSIPWVSWGELILIVVISFIFYILALFRSYILDLGIHSDLVIQTMGVKKPSQDRFLFFLLTSLWLGVLTAVSGTIGFVGLIVPHYVRHVFRPQHAMSFFLFSSLVGSVFLVFCDILSRSIYPPLEFPIGIMTTLLGAPWFIHSLWNEK